jgi:hypothetical protein
MDEPECEWVRDLCGGAYHTEVQVLECAWLDHAYGPGTEPQAQPRLVTAA